MATNENQDLLDELLKAILQPTPATNLDKADFHHQHAARAVGQLLQPHLDGDHIKGAATALHVLVMAQFETNSLLREVLDRLPKPVDIFATQPPKVDLDGAMKTT